MGAGLGEVFAAGETPDLSIIFDATYYSADPGSWRLCRCMPVLLKA